MARRNGHKNRGESQQRRDRTWSMTSGERCPEDGKRCYPSRKAARRDARVLMPGESVSVYRCGDWFHIGHTPYLIARGVIARPQ